MKYIAAFLMVSLTALLLWLPTIKAGGCYQATYQQHGYHAPTYGYQSYYQPTQYYPRTIYQYEEVIIPKATRVFISPDFYWGLSEEYLDRKRSTKEKSIACDEKIASVQKELDELRKQFAAPSAKAQPVEQGTGGSGNLIVPEGLAKLVENSCLKCHGASASDKGGGFDMRSLSSMSAGKRAECFARVQVGQMPKASAALKDEEAKLFEQFVVQNFGKR